MYNKTKNEDDEVWQQLQSPRQREPDRLDVFLLLWANQANQINQLHLLQKGKSQMAQVVKQRLPPPHRGRTPSLTAREGGLSEFQSRSREAAQKLPFSSRTNQLTALIFADRSSVLQVRELSLPPHLHRQITTE
ncbi:unnamed protein product [Pleuronectes platessa]|uniref:Uncharacterized protein n=1 Tax=Pleuronectes platessa TaxID=8262 RepID=A0A9N7VI46_PLEPL|nr:unnamed protein product [Pleuronectes platessa]